MAKIQQAQQSNEFRELELKLELAGGNIKTIAKRLSERFGGDDGGKPLSAWRPQLDVYWDTSDLRLRRHGFTLRTRKSGDALKQTLKQSDKAAALALDRKEWEIAHHDEVPDLLKFADPAILEQMGPVWGYELKPIFKIANERLRLLVDWQPNATISAVIELAIDNAKVMVGRKKRRFQEIELELKAGDSRALPDLAVQLQDEAKLRVSTLSKADRGFELVSPSIPKAATAKEAPLSSAHTAKQAMVRIVAGCLNQAISNIRAAHDGRDIEGVHQLRVALRRGQAAVKLFRPLLAKDTAKAWSAIFRERRQILGHARDLDVLRSEILLPIHNSRLIMDDHGASLVALSELLTEIRAGIQSELAGRLYEPAFSQGLLTVAAGLNRLDLTDPDSAKVRQAQARPIQHFAARKLAKSHKQVLAAAGPRIGDLPIAQIHAVRLELKALRYGVDFFGGLFPRKAVKPFRKALKDLQELLGRINDAEVASMRINEAIDGQTDPCLPAAAHFIAGWQAAELQARLPDLQERFDAFADQQPFWIAH